MSGIAGVIRFGGTIEVSELEAMLATMARRGPDGQTLVCHGEAGFGHALLATTPEALAERQPWRHPDSGCMVVSDSRLDNRPQLIRDLGINRPADEVGDGELLHAAWQRWREGCADRLRGDFAFAIWHPGNQELFVARDPMGVRPLQFHFAQGRLFVFGSSSDTVIAQGDVPTDVNEGRIADALIGETEGIDQTCTLYTAVQRLPPAHWMRLRDGQLTQERYWKPVGDEPPSGLPNTTTEWVEAQREHLDRAVQLRLRSSRRVGSMLSGGIDSSAVVALAAKTSSQPPFPVFSAINSGTPNCTETAHIRAVIEHLRCTPTLIDLAEFERTRTPGPTWWDEGVEPFDSAMTMIAEVYRAASTHGVVSVMDGLPADNLYTTGRYVHQLFRRGRWADAWHAAVAQCSVRGARRPRLRAMKVLFGCVAPEPLHALRQWLHDQHAYQRLLRNSPICRDLAKRSHLWARYRRYSRDIGSSHQWDASGSALSCLTAAYITAAMERYNRVASAFGVEPRSPFADRELIEFQAWVPPSLRTRQGHLKWVLRQAVANELPNHVVWRGDKSHIGWRFTVAQLRHSLPELGELSTPPVSNWLNAQRVAATYRIADAERRMGELGTAAGVLRWLQSSQK